MRKLRVTLLAACLLAIGLSACGGGEPYSFAMPSGWKSQDVDDSAEAVAQSGLDPSEVRSLAVMETASPYASVFVVMKPKGLRGLNLEQFTRAATETVDAAARRRSLAKRIDLDGERAVQFDFTGSSGGLTANVRSVLVVHDRTHYLLRFVSHNFDDDRRALEEILASWEWK